MVPAIAAAIIPLIRIWNDTGIPNINPVVWLTMNGMQRNPTINDNLTVLVRSHSPANTATYIIAQNSITGAPVVVNAAGISAVMFWNAKCD